jgi:hypothetical protein
MDLDLSSRSTLSGNDQFKSPSFLSFTTPRLVIKSELTYSQKKPPNRQQISLERINQLAQPKGRRFHRTEEIHIRTAVLGALTVQDLFGNIDDKYHGDNSLLSNEQKPTTDDKRFRQLVHLFSEVHERAPSNIQSVKNVIQSNASLQYNSEQWEINNTIEEEHNQQILDDSCYNKTDMYLIDACA